MFLKKRFDIILLLKAFVSLICFHVKTSTKALAHDIGANVVKQ